MVRRRRPFHHRCLPHIACFRIQPREEQEPQQQRQEEEEEEDDEQQHQREPQQNPHAERSRGKRWLSSKCRRIALDLALLLSSTAPLSDPHPQNTSRPIYSNLLSSRRHRAPEEDKSWLLEPVKRTEESCADQHSTLSSSRFSLGSQLDIHLDKATVLLVNLENDQDDLPSTPSSTRTSKERPLVVFSYLESAISPVVGALVRFSYQEIRVATKGFCRGRVVGRGALSCVFKGRVRRTVVAVKRLEGPEKECAKLFCRELRIAGVLCNENVVPLVGYCIDKEGLFIVYKYVSGGSLDQHLFRDERNGEKSGAKEGVGVPWSTRFKVALGVARALEYLHFGTDKCIIHRDVKPSNVLLSSNNTPKLCDFGLATWTQGPSLPFLCKTVKGTFGYLSPEYFQHGKLSDKTDVYAYGVLLLELISGMKAIDSTRAQGEENLVIWARPFLQQGDRALKHLVDPRLTGSYSHTKMSRVVLTATACLEPDDLSRPNIREAIQILCGDENATTVCRSLTSNHYFTHYGPPSEDLSTESDRKSHLALAMLGVSESEHDDVHSN